MSSLFETKATWLSRDLGVFLENETRNKPLDPTGSRTWPQGVPSKKGPFTHKANVIPHPSKVSASDVDLLIFIAPRNKNGHVKERRNTEKEAKPGSTW